MGWMPGPPCASWSSSATIGFRPCRSIRFWWLLLPPLGFVPLVAKETKGHSFPSRHALSAAVLAMTWLRFFPAVGVAMVIITLLICALRVLVGVHSVPDVLFGAALGFGLGAVGLWLL